MLLDLLYNVKKKGLCDNHVCQYVILYKTHMCSIDCQTLYFCQYMYKHSSVQHLQLDI